MRFFSFLGALLTEEFYPIFQFTLLVLFNVNLHMYISSMLVPFFSVVFVAVDSSASQEVGLTGVEVIC